MIVLCRFDYYLISIVVPNGTNVLFLITHCSSISIVTFIPLSKTTFDISISSSQYELLVSIETFFSSFSSPTKMLLEIFPESVVSYKDTYL